MRPPGCSTPKMSPSDGVRSSCVAPTASGWNCSCASSPLPDGPCCGPAVLHANWMRVMPLPAWFGVMIGGWQNTVRPVLPRNGPFAAAMKSTYTGSNSSSTSYVPRLFTFSTRTSTMNDESKTLTLETAGTMRSAAKPAGTVAVGAPGVGVFSGRAGRWRLGRRAGVGRRRCVRRAGVPVGVSVTTGVSVGVSVAVAVSAGVSDGVGVSVGVSVDVAVSRGRFRRCLRGRVRRHGRVGRRVGRRRCVRRCGRGRVRRAGVFHVDDAGERDGIDRRIGRRAQ